MSDIPRRIETKAQDLGFARPAEPLFMNYGSGWPFTRSRDCYYPEGIVGTRGDYPPFLHVAVGQRWDDVTDLQYKRTTTSIFIPEHSTVETCGLTRYIATFKSGQVHAFRIMEDTENTLAHNYSRYGIRRDVRPQIAAANETRRTINEAVAHAQLPLMVVDLRHNKQVNFGSVYADSDGIHQIDSDLLFPWQSSSISERQKDDRGKLRPNRSVTQENTVRLTSDHKQGLELPVSDIHNLGALMLLHDHMRQQ